MNGWLILWLAMALFGFLVLAIIGKIEWPEYTEFDGRVIFAIFAGLIICAIGLLGTFGWLIAWGFG